MDVTAATTFGISALALCAAPGPAIASLLLVARNHSFQRTLVYNGGIILGLSLSAIASAIGLFSLIQAIPSAEKGLTFLAFGYFLYLSYRIITAPVGQTIERPNQLAHFASAVFLGLANPKGYVVFLSLFASHTIMQDQIHADILVKLSLTFLSLILVCSLWMYVGIVIGKMSLSHRIEHYTNWILGGLVFATAVMTLLG
ncbi:MAG: LysE family transporter [Cohaesibacter sp.]|nr:LysE family transporter [Cohaesibacter sp.]MCV6603065.1 LysE family transporter [Cohaesibacter sp.]